MTQRTSPEPQRGPKLSAAQVKKRVEHHCGTIVVADGHTHKFEPRANTPEFGGRRAEPLYLGLIEDEIAYHYVLRDALALEVITPKQLKEWTKRRVANRIWDRMFVRRRGATNDRLFVGVDEGCLGVRISLLAQGYDPYAATLDDVYKAEAKLDPDENLDRAMQLAGVSTIVQTNTPTEPGEDRFYRACAARGEWDPRFRHALRLDPMTLKFVDPDGKPGSGGQRLRQMGYDVTPGKRTKQNVAECTRFMDDWGRLFPDLQYVASSFGPEIDVSDTNTTTGWMMNEVVLPWCRKNGVPFFLMPGPVRALQPTWGNAGDGMGFCNFAPYQKLLKDWPDVQFILTVLHAANQQDANVLACHNGNLTGIGHWWFNLAPALAGPVLASRLQLLGTRHVAFNSDARVKGNLISKWIRFRALLARELTTLFLDQLAHGLSVTDAEIADTVKALFQMPVSKMARK